MGESLASVDQMVKYFESVGKPYLSSVYAKYGAADIRRWCEMLLQEAKAEGVRAEVVFCQAMLETGWLQFGNLVQAEQCNFCGLGATGPGSPGIDFSSNGSFAVWVGIRVHVQHLKAYASTEPLNNPCVDPRFTKVTRGCAETIEGLNGKWAVPGNGYGEAIVSSMGSLLVF